MKINFELDGWFPEMLIALNDNRKIEGDLNSLCKTIVQSWLIDNQESFEKEFKKIIQSKKESKLQNLSNVGMEK